MDRIAEPRSPSEMESLTRDENIRLLAQRQEDGARANLVEALAVQGKFDEAIAITTDPQKKEFLELLKTADTTPDDDRCECKHTVDAADYVRNPNAQPKPIPSPNYLKRFRFLSPNYERMAWLHVCHLCGHANALPDDIPIAVTKTGE